MHDERHGLFHKIADAFRNEGDVTPVVDPRGKYWDGQRWFVDGEPVTYRVAWTTNGEPHEERFTDIDQGYSFYELMQKDADVFGVRFDHLPW